jgi:signal transduction histidine kinase
MRCFADRRKNAAGWQERFARWIRWNVIGVKLSFVNLKEKLVLPAEYQVNFERSINQLDNTISELRKIAHNLMPEVLVNFD